MGGWAGAVTVLLTAAAVGLLPPLLRALPEPVTSSGGTGPGYRSLADGRTVLTHTLAAAVAVLVVLLAVPGALRPLWWPLLACGVAAAVVDARSTWIPRQLCWAGWALGVPAAAAALLLGTGRPQLLAAATGAVAAAALFWLAWRISRGGIGFADVRIAPLVGLAAGSLGPLGWWWSLLLGTALGAVVALLRRTLGRPGPTPYAPALVAGPFLAALLAPLAG